MTATNTLQLIRRRMKIPLLISFDVYLVLSTPLGRLFTKLGNMEPLFVSFVRGVSLDVLRCAFITPKRFRVMLRSREKWQAAKRLKDGRIYVVTYPEDGSC
jgi:hypothetical protein